MPTATWNGQVLAESDDTVVVEGNCYFPLDSIREEFFVEVAQTSSCPWKGEASYFDLAVDGSTNPAAAWTYRDPKPAAADIRDRFAFWRGVEIS